MPFADPGLSSLCADLLAREPGCDIATLVAPETVTVAAPGPTAVATPDAVIRARAVSEVLHTTSQSVTG